MAAPKLNMFEKFANMSGTLYRYHAAQFPRRWNLVKKIAERELAPPKTSDWPVIKKEFNQLLNSIHKKEYKNLSVRVSSLNLLTRFTINKLPVFRNFLSTLPSVLKLSVGSLWAK